MRALGVVLVLVVVGVSAISIDLAGAVISLLPFGSTNGAAQCAANSPNCMLALAASTLEYHIKGVNLNQYDTWGGNPSSQPVDPLLVPIWNYWKADCGGSVCSDMDPQGIQCVEFVKGVFYLAHQPIPDGDHPDAFDWWAVYANKPGWKEIPVAAASSPALRGLPQSGDVVTMSNSKNPAGHIAIVVWVSPPTATTDGAMWLAQGNGPGNEWPGTDWPGNFLRIPIHPDYSVNMAAIGWPSFQVWGYIREVAPRSPTPTNLPASPYVQQAASAAQQQGLPAAWFEEQIRQESDYDPHACSVGQYPNCQGAEGIAQFEPGTAASHGVDPWDPSSALPGATKFMVQLLTGFNPGDPGTDFGDYAAALAGYNAGPGAVQMGHNPDWLAGMGADVQRYTLSILYYP